MELCRTFKYKFPDPLSPYLTGMRQLDTSSRIVRDKDKRYKHNFHVAVSLNRHFCNKFANFSLILKIYGAIVGRLSCDSRATFVRVSHDFPANVTYFHLNSYDSRATFMRVSRDICTNVA